MRRKCIVQAVLYNRERREEGKARHGHTRVAGRQTDPNRIPAAGALDGRKANSRAVSREG